jgi:hypothetical protein
MYAKQDAEHMDVEKTKIKVLETVLQCLIEVQKSLRNKDKQGDSTEPNPYWIQSMGLRKEHQQELLNPVGWLDDIIINATMDILWDQLLEVLGYQHHVYRTDLSATI